MLRRFRRTVNYSRIFVLEGVVESNHSEKRGMSVFSFLFSVI
jgi:hypothetical protein